MPKGAEMRRDIPGLRKNLDTNVFASKLNIGKNGACLPPEAPVPCVLALASTILAHSVTRLTISSLKQQVHQIIT